MRVIGIILAACMMLAVLKVAIVALLLLCGVFIVVGAFTHPAETFGLLTVALLFALFNYAPLLVAGTLCALCVLGAWAKRPDK